jgi:hypothetical protein
MIYGNEHPFKMRIRYFVLFLESLFLPSVEKIILQGEFGQFMFDVGQCKFVFANSCLFSPIHACFRQIQFAQHKKQLKQALCPLALGDKQAI